MSYQKILEAKKHMEFRLTESETLVKLVEEAVSKGVKVQKEMKRLSHLSENVRRILDSHGFMYKESVLNEVKPVHSTVVGIDGSFQLVGGAGGKWYAPISVARVLFENGLGSTPKIDIYYAGIEEIDEKEEPKPNIVATVMMLSGETKAILDWGSRKRPAYVMIDGPIVDPPVFSFGGLPYIKDRCEALGKCLESSTIIGCVKRSRDKFFIKYLSENLEGENIKQTLKEFPSDQHLMAYVFGGFRSEGYYGPIFTSFIDISNENDVYKAYRKEGVYVKCLFAQKNVKSQVLRIDIASSTPFMDDVSLDHDSSIDGIKTVIDWIYPGQDYPLPVYLAHQKCNIREGCAEVLYDEIMTKSLTVDPRNQIIMTQLR